MFGHSVRTSFYYISVGLSEPSITTVFVESIGSLSESADFNQKITWQSDESWRSRRKVSYFKAMAYISV